ncbi:MAG: hypothetical protein H6729_12825, partial [Deltaproteobacteria bacterium]|nr:hypothetical protein [Deltaproteobacteria bacterium]
MADLSRLEDIMVAQHGESARGRIRRGLRQVDTLWRADDGDQAAFEAFVTKHFVTDPTTLESMTKRLEEVLEAADGHLSEIQRSFRRATDLDTGPLLEIDPLLAATDPSAHLLDDLFASKIAFVVLLNMPVQSLAEKVDGAARWRRRDWATARLADRFAERVPGEVVRGQKEAEAAADLYIANYNIWMHNVLDPQGRRLFPEGMRLVSHWNLRDEIKANYGRPDGLARQRLITTILTRIVDETIPHVVIDNPRVDWSPISNQIQPNSESARAGTAGATATTATAAAPEPTTRYAMLLAQFRAAQRFDTYTPTATTAIARAFERDRELSEERVISLLKRILESPEVPRIAALIARRLGRPLEPHDLWYAGFRAGSNIDEAALDARVRQRYPTPEAFAQDMPRILRALGFSKSRAQYLAERIAVDPARGAGHAMPALRRGDRPRLRTRIGPSGMDYKGYNIAIHEFGHNVEQVFSLYDVDSTLLRGVPNNAFTEALAFVFQARDLLALGLDSPKDQSSEDDAVLAKFWQTWELAGVALVDLEVWRWMYAHPNATPEALKAAVSSIAIAHWNAYYKDVLGKADVPLLAVYSHMIAYPLYLADYPLGLLIAFQIEAAMQRAEARGIKLGDEFERMAKFGRVLPDVWMEHATGSPISAEPLLQATHAAVGR